MTCLVINGLVYKFVTFLVYIARVPWKSTVKAVLIPYYYLIVKSLDLQICAKMSKLFAKGKGVWRRKNKHFRKTMHDI